MKWLLQRIQGKTHDENRGYAAELLAILLQDNTRNRLQLGELDGVEAILKVLSVGTLDSSKSSLLTHLQQYRFQDPRDADETEFMENLFDVLCSALAEPAIKELFLKSEGVDLMVLTMKFVSLLNLSRSLCLRLKCREKKQSRSRSVKVIDHALSGAGGVANCEAFVEASGLKTLFPALMGKVCHFEQANNCKANHGLSNRRKARAPSLHKKTRATYLVSCLPSSPISSRTRRRAPDCLQNSSSRGTRRSTDFWSCAREPRLGSLPRSGILMSRRRFV